MSNISWKNFNQCFSKIKCLPMALSSSPTIDDQEDKNWSSPTTNNSALLKNFNSIYEDFTSSTTEDHFSSGSDSDSDCIPDISTVFASQRFFFSTPGSSNSIVDQSLDTPLESTDLVTGSVAVQTYSPDPYSDFRRSMQEMVEARELTDVKANWEMLHELLLCYLSLNPKHNHKFIVNAFADLLISLISSSSTTTN